MKRIVGLFSGIAAFVLLAGTAMARDVKTMPAPEAAPALSTAPIAIGCGDSSCCNTSCCENGCDPRGGGVIADIGFMVLTPRFTENPAYFTNNQGIGPGGDYTQQDFSYHPQLVPQFSLGYIAPGGLGFRINWWGFTVGADETGTSTQNIIFLAADPLQIQERVNPVEAFSIAGQSLVAQTRLHMDVWDFEGVDEVRTENWSWLGSLGLRYAHISQSYDATVVNANGTFGNFIRSGQNFNGAGPTASLEGRRRLGNGGLFLYGQARGSILFGTSKQAATEKLFFDTTPEAAESRSNSVIPEGELEAGAGFQRETGLGNVFVKLGLVAQAWLTAGNASDSSGAGFLGEGRGNSGSGSIDRNATLGLIGFTMTAGINY